ncbi:hypothetical protein [Edaphobacter bradus]|uniref:hypothetical protein n=1 Tax=Edaphobacter bradus TaxID=2259016 RepID=UPI0021E08026|nr:hypothetical protein [Edaphobacter bradus]
MKHFRTLLAILFVTALLLAIPRRTEAQTAIYGGFSGANITSGPTSSAYGGMVGLYAQSGHYAYFGGDFRGTFLSRNGFNYFTGALGPRLAFKPPVLPLRPYIEGLVGVASYNGGGNSSSSNHLNYQAVVGADWTLVPHIDWRVLEYAYSGTNGGPLRANIFSTGLVVRLW